MTTGVVVTRVVRERLIEGLCRPRTTRRERLGPPGTGRFGAEWFDAECRGPGTRNSAASETSL
ncbi:hypothetical protein GCM10009634_15160 [Saccharothrix xinjiangensis]